MCTYVCSFCICECGSGCIFARGCHLHLLLAPTTHNPSPPWKKFNASSYSFPTYKAYFISLTATASPLEKELTVHTFHCTSLKFSKPFSYVLAAIMILLASGRRCLGYGNFDFLASIVKYFICYLHVQCAPLAIVSNISPKALILNISKASILNISCKFQF